MSKFVDINCATSPDAALLEEFIDWVVRGKVKVVTVSRHPGRHEGDGSGEPIVRFGYDEVS